MILIRHEQTEFNRIFSTTREIPDRAVDQILLPKPMLGADGDRCCGFTIHVSRPATTPLSAG